MTMKFILNNFLEILKRMNFLINIYQRKLKKHIEYCFISNIFLFKIYFIFLKDE